MILLLYSSGIRVYPAAKISGNQHKGPGQTGKIDLMTKNTEKRTVKLDNGEEAPASFPVIVSASRSTDIPAFYSDWFFERLKRGYSAWINPFNGKKY